ncbi:hypothetical protein EDC04DRAFT_2612009 [Pisolithus marmoratus]|nr:hypothetical protein EDC04DRAFT_2612009 [Pisolithus marmoratus]
MVGMFWPRSRGEDDTIIGGIIMIIRVYALCMKSRRVLLFLVAVILAGLSVGCLDLCQLLHCAMDVMSTFPMKRIAIAWSTQLVFDAAVFVLTLWRTLRSLRLGDRALLDIFTRDGALYFGLMTGANAANITAILVFNTVCPLLKLVCQQRNYSFRGSPTCKDFPSPSHSPTHATSSTMVSRLMLNLRDPKILVSSQPMMPVAHHWKRNSGFELQTMDNSERNTYYVAED